MNPNRQRNLKTQRGFVQCVTLLEQYQEIMSLNPAFLLLTNPMDYINVNVRLDLDLKVSKSETSPEQLKAIISCDN